MFYISNKNSNKSLPSKSICNFLKIYFDFTYHGGLTPFKIKWINGQFILHTNPFQKIVVGLMIILAIPWIFYPIRNASSLDTSHNPNRFLEMAQEVVNTILKVATIKTFWQGGQSFVNILNFVHFHFPTLSSCSHKSNFWAKYSVKRKAFLICSVYTLVLLVQMFRGRGIVSETHPISEWTAKWWWGRLITVGRYNFYMGSFTGSNITFSVGDQLIGIIGFVGHIPRRFLALHCDLIVLMAVLTLWTATTAFQEMLKLDAENEMTLESEHIYSPEDFVNRSKITTLTKNPFNTQSNRSKFQVSKHTEWTLIRRNYTALKHLSHLINQVLGFNVTLFMVETLLYYAVSFESFFTGLKKDVGYVATLDLIFEAGNACTILLLCADIPYKMHSLKEWFAIDANREQVPSDLLYLIASEIDDCSVSIKGSNIFVVNYSTLASMLGITITYLIICLQA